MARYVIFNPNETVTTIGTLNNVLSPVTLTMPTTSSPVAAGSVSPTGTTPSPAQTSPSIFNSNTLHNTSPATASTSQDGTSSSHASSSTTGTTGTTTGTTTGGSTAGTPTGAGLAGSVSKSDSHALAIALGIVIPLIVLAALFAIIMYRRRVRRNQQTVIDGMTIVPPSLELPAAVERRRPGSHVLSWLSLPNWRASVGGTTAMRPGLKPDEPQTQEEKGREVDERLDSPRDVPRYVSGDWRFTNPNDNLNEHRNTTNADRLVLVNGRLALWTDHSQHT